VATGRVKVPDLKHKFAEIQKTVGVPMIFMASTANTKMDSPYRKPQVGMFERVCKLMGSAPDLSKSFYCGDAAGRTNDHTNDDLLFSINNKLKFYTPEMLF
jgi:bifunctional polynucleotide phosphatase/kinase